MGVRGCQNDFFFENENSPIALDWEVGTNHGATQGATGATGATVWRRKEKEEGKERNRKGKRRMNKYFKN